MFIAKCFGDFIFKILTYVNILSKCAYTLFYSSFLTDVLGMITALIHVENMPVVLLLNRPVHTYVVCQDTTRLAISENISEFQNFRCKTIEQNTKNREDFP